MVTYKFPGDKEKNGGPISNSLLSKLQKDILTGKLKAGQKLTEQELCREYEVSRTPVREALRQLETDGLVENILNRGAFVIGMSEQDYEDMFEMRKIYEIQAVKWAIERITEEEMETHPKRHMLMKAVGVERTVCPDFFRIDLEEGQTYRLLLCSDGLSGFCSDAEIQEVLQEDVSDTETAQKLIDAALEKGGRDNISVAIATVSHNTEE